MGVEPRAGAARSDMPESNRTKGRSEVVCMGNNQGRSTTWSVFNKLGRGTDMRKTLNRKQEQERFQYSTSQRVRIEANSQGLRNILLEDLRCAIVTIEEQDDELVAKAGGGSSFCKEIQEAPLPEGFKLPNIKAYEGKADPRDHLDHFNDLMELHIVSDQANIECTLLL